MSARSIVAGYWVLTAALGAAVAAKLVVAPIAWGLFGLLAAAAVLVGVRRNAPARTWPWQVLATAILIWTMADLLLFDAAANAGSDLVAATSVLYLVSFIAATAALLRFGRSDTAGLAPAGLLDALIVIVVLLLLVWVTTFGRLGLAAWADDHFLIAYPIGDALLLATAVRLLTTGRRSPAAFMLVAGTAATLVADSVFSATAGVAAVGRVAASVQDVGWLFFYACCGAAALHPSMSRLTDPEPIAARELSLRRIWAIAATVLVAPTILLVEAVLGEVDDGIPLALGGAALILLSLARVAATANIHSRSLVYRERQDTLTGLASRAHLVERLTADETRSWSAVMLLDLDEFRLINDDAGHSVGDQVLVTVARRLARQMGRHDLVARSGGDEFAVLVGPPARDLATLTSDVATAIGSPVVVGGREIPVSACIGVAAANDNATGPVLLQQAGLALQAAKAAGPAEICHYESERHGILVERMRLREALSRAVIDRAFTLHYQPIVALDTGATIGFEALVRWAHPTRGLVGPAEFIEVAEETGLIEPIGEYVLRTAVADAAAWCSATQTEAYVSVNVSARQFRHASFADLVENVVVAAGLRPDLLMLELTESALMRDDDRVWVELATLRHIGVRLAIDDFGTGFSSLSYLEQTPIDVIKIDKSFVDSLVPSHRQRTVVEGIMRMAEKLGLEIVAEGVETEAERDLLAEMRCPYGQGYLYAGPLTHADAIRWLAARLPVAPTQADPPPPSPPQPQPFAEPTPADPGPPGPSPPLPRTAAEASPATEPSPPAEPSPAQEPNPPAEPAVAGPTTSS